MTYKGMIIFCFCEFSRQSGTSYVTNKKNNYKHMNINIKTNAGGQTEFEREYLYDFLLKKCAQLENHGEIIVFSSNQKSPEIEFKITSKDILLHLSNENLRCDYSFLTNKQTNKQTNTVLRSYYNPLIKHKNCFAIPLGYQTGFRNIENIKGDNNQYMWSFIGQMKSFRKPMYDAFQKYEPNFASFSQTWNSQSLSFDEVKQIYLNTAFAPCPFGSVHADTIRVMEVLEWGCIPVVVHFLGNDYYKYIYGDHPFIVGNNWNDAAQKAAAIYENKILLKKKQTELAVWYKKFKDDLTSDIVSIVSGHFENLKSSQLKYQKAGRNDLLMKARYYYHFHIKTKTIY